MATRKRRRPEDGRPRLPKGVARSKSVMVRLTPRVHSFAQRVAQKRRETVSGVIREMVEAQMAREAQEKTAQGSS